MFERYNINNLFIASVSVSYPENKLGVDKIGGILEIATAGYGYVTILRKDKDKYIDLQDGSTMMDTIDPNKLSHTIDYMEPLSKYYNKDGKKKDTLSKKEAIGLSLKYYKEFHKDEEAQKVRVYNNRG